MTMRASKDWERRRYPRARFDQLVKIASDGQLITATAQEIGEGGVRLEASGLAPYASTVAISIPFFDYSQPVLGQVVWRREQMVGVAFHTLPPRHQMQLQIYVQLAEPHL